MSGINRCLLDLLVHTLDKLAPESLGLSVRRDKGDSDSTMTKLSASRKNLRPDGQLRSRDGKRLLFKWEEKGAGASLDDAVEDLKRESCSLSVYFCGRKNLYTPSNPEAFLNLQEGTVLLLDAGLQSAAVAHTAASARKLGLSECNLGQLMD